MQEIWEVLKCRAHVDQCAQHHASETQEQQYDLEVLGYEQATAAFGPAKVKAHINDL